MLLLSGTAIILAVVIAAGYFVPWTGFDQNLTNQHTSGIKTLWDWLQLLGGLAIPVTIALYGAAETRRQDAVSEARRKQEQEIADARRKQEQEIADAGRKQDQKLEDTRRRETALQTYFDRMSELLLHESLADSRETDPVRNVARSTTLTVLRRFSRDAVRASAVMQFLVESGLNNKEEPIVSLSGINLAGAWLNGAEFDSANLSEVNLNDAHLREADLSEANLSGAYLNDAHLKRIGLLSANLSKANLRRADLRWADLRHADLRHAELSMSNLSGADLSRADLSGAGLSGTDLSEANLSGTNLSGADLKIAHLMYLDGRDAGMVATDLSRAWGLFPEQVKAAKHWEQALYDASFRAELGLPPESDPAAQPAASTQQPAAATPTPPDAATPVDRAPSASPPPAAARDSDDGAPL